MTEFSFAAIPVPNRDEKPRRRGITMMIDWGIPLGLQKDVVASQGHLVDKAKIAAGIPRFMPPDLLRRKIAAYRDAGIATANGGLLTELVLKQGTYDALLAGMAELGFDSVEVSENLQVFSREEKTRAVRLAKDSYGLSVIGEVGRKEGRMTDKEVLEDIETYLGAGADCVYIEAAEMFDGDGARDSLIRTIDDNFPPETILYELPVDVLPGITRAIKHKTASRLVAMLGTNVNLANVEHYEVCLLECLRRGIAGDTMHPQGAFRLAGIGSESSSRDSLLPQRRNAQ